MQHVVDSRSGQHVGNRDYTPKSEYFAVAGGGGAADAKQTRRILAIAMVLDGHSRRLAAQAGGMDRQTLRDWVWQGFAADWSSDQRAFKNVPWGSWLISGRFGLCTWLELLHVR